MTRRHIRVVIAILLIAAIGAFYVYGRSLWFPLFLQIRGERSVADVVAKYGPAARARLVPYFQRAGVAYPPKRIALLAFKRENRLALWAQSSNGPWRFIRDYPIRAASGHAGPKLRQGDYQVPEGVYRIEHLNPNSNYHMSMKVSYPNDFDRRMAAHDHRTNLGGDIFIHGKALSIGCLAMGDPAIEELFTLVAQTGHERVKVIIAPNDLRTGGAIVHPDAPVWVGQLYRIIGAALADFPVWMESGSAIDVTGRSKAMPLRK
ncbi:MAG TPA: L,D-transpeptidase family protein [Thermoanaerobaculia bacterium]|nr:L,D-transpeptidase family protein [Thermoanaerobaculia bacterium]